jgi:hypothetical protein
MCMLTGAMMATGGGAALMGNIGLGMTIGQGVMGYMGAKDSADAQEQYSRDSWNRSMAERHQQNEWQIERYEENAGRVVDNASDYYKDSQTAIGQQNVKYAMEINNYVQQSRQLSSATAAGQAERGVDGISAQYVNDMIAQTELAAVETTKKEQRWYLDQAYNEMDGAAKGFQSQIDSMNVQPIALPPLPTPVQQPNPFAYLLNTGAGLMQGLNQWGFRGIQSPSGAATGGANTVYTNPNTGNSGSNQLYQ